jgi:regulator of protease activity HflC (stomatin/prohibitin superfamily)
MAEVKIDGEAARAALRKVAGRAGLIIPGVIVLAGVLSSYFTVPADSEAVILRFGKYNRTAEPGLHFKMPFWFETKEIIPVARTLKMEFGFGTDGSTNPYQTRPQEHAAEQSMITGDKNSALVEWVVQYRISDPEAYLFRVRDPEDTMRDASESVMREVVGDRTVDEVITIGRQSIETDALVKLQELIDSYGQSRSTWRKGFITKRCLERKERRIRRSVAPRVKRPNGSTKRRVTLSDFWHFLKPTRRHRGLPGSACISRR